MKTPVPEFLKAIAVTVGGAGLSIRELLTNGSLILTCVGAGLACIGGYWAYRSKRTEHEIKKVELRIKQEELRALQRANGARR